MKTKATLRNTHNAHELPAPSLSAADIVALRESLNMSRGLFARRLRVSPRTLQNWEQGRATVPVSAAILLVLVRTFPDTLQRLAKV
jgi:putative transcriptional regulator